MKHTSDVNISTAADSGQLDHQACYQALRRRDSRFDGRFYTGVTTTGIFCRPSCPARTPKSSNIKFFHHAAAASEAGYRPCRRCRPELAPSSPEWNRRADLAGKALQLIDQGDLDRLSVKQVAAKLGVSERHLRRELQTAIGVGPHQLARTRRLTTARILLDQTSLPITDIAFASGFSSIRQFNDAFKETFDSPPSLLRSQPSQRGGEAPNEIVLTFTSRGESQWGELFSFFRARAIPGLEAVGPAAPLVPSDLGEPDISTFQRGVPGGWIELSGDNAGITLRCSLDKLDRVADLVYLVRRVTDIDTDLQPVTEHLAKDPLLADRLQSNLVPRLPGAFDRFEVAIRAIIGQQVSVAGARTTLGKLIALVDNQHDRPTVPNLRPGFPTADEIATTSLDNLGVPSRRRTTVGALAVEVAEGRIDLSPASDADRTYQQLLDLPGIGPWTAGYIAMRALNNPNGWPADDLVVKKSLGLSTKELEQRSMRWQPWRGYAALLAWRTSKLDQSKKGATK